MKLRPLFLIISLTLVAVSIYSEIKWGFRPSIDFAGGTTWEIKLPSIKEKSKIEELFKNNNISVSSLSTTDQGYQIKSQYLNESDKEKIVVELKKLDKDYQDLRFETLGPSLGRELFQKTILAIILSALTILIFLARSFNDWSFGLGAIIAMFHDTFILIGAFSLFGHYFGAEVDSLFVTAVLTTLSSSVHDTVVTFHRMRELKRQYFSSNWVELANQAITETINRSINNSMTIVFMLFALVVLGGEATRWFAVALLVGVIVGTYSSTAVAIPIVLLLKNRKK